MTFLNKPSIENPNAALRSQSNKLNLVKQLHPNTCKHSNSFYPILRKTIQLKSSHLDEFAKHLISKLKLLDLTTGVKSLNAIRVALRTL